MYFVIYPKVHIRFREKEVSEKSLIFGKKSCLLKKKNNILLKSTNINLINTL